MGYKVITRSAGRRKEKERESGLEEEGRDEEERFCEFPLSLARSLTRAVLSRHVPQRSQTEEQQQAVSGSVVSCR